jgi:hypothetical protein
MLWRSGWFWLIVAVVFVMIVIYLASATLQSR